MPRKLDARGLGLAALVVTGCIFSADYHGHYTCSDGVCPSGLVCSTTKTCVAPGDAMLIDAPKLDAPPAALTCADPGPVPAAGGMTSGTTAGRTSTIAATCAATIMNGPDAIYRVPLASAATITLTITGGYPVNAYVIAPCAPLPATPACLGNTFAAAGSPAVINAPGAGDYFVIVDGINAALFGTYLLGVTVN